MSFVPKLDHGGLLRHVPVRILLVILVLVPWGGMAYRTADRVDHDRGELAFTEELAPAAVRVKLLARVQRELEIEAAVAELKVSRTVSEVVIQKDLTDSRRRIDQALGALEVFAPNGIRRADLTNVRTRFDSTETSIAPNTANPDTTNPNTADPSSGYADLLATNRAALNTSVRELWVLVAMLGGDQTMRDNLRALEFSMNATDSSIRESNLLLHQSAVGSPDQVVMNLIGEEQRSALRALRSVSVLPVPVAKSAKQAIANTDEAAIAQAMLWTSVSTAAKPRLSMQQTKQLYQLLAGRTARLGAISDETATALSVRSQRLIGEQRNNISEFTWMLLASLVLTLIIAAVVGSSVQLAVRRLSESILVNNRLRDEFEYAANHDALTGLPNRPAVYRHLEELLQNNVRIALLFVDLDHFKRANDTEGHLAGDEILRVMAARFAQSAGPNRMVARLGGDEFLIVCQGETVEAAGLLADDIRATASDPVDLGSSVVNLGASAGAAESQQGDTASSLLKRADQALYEAKAAGRNSSLVTVHSQ